VSNFIKSIATNPLLRDLPLDISWAQWMDRLACNPFEGEDIQAMSPVLQELMLDQYEKLYVPTAATAQIAFNIHRMIMGGLIDRHPYSPEHKRHMYDMCRAGEGSLVTFPESTAPPRGMLLKGVTKLGKSTLVQRVLQQYPQVFVRERDDRAGWLELRQLMYLVIPMPTDASKSGFLMNAFVELDRALGTSYSEEATIRNATIDIQLVKLLALLVKQRCGALIIEEGQESNELNNVKFGRSFETFFLRVLNTGIPTILIGNPKAFDELETSSQLMGRLSNPGAQELAPCLSDEDPDWVDEFVPRIWGTNLLPEPDEPIPDLAKFLWQRTGGFVHYLSMLRRESTRIALVSGSPRLKRGHIDQAMASTIMQVGAKIITSYWKGRAGKETDYTDIPGAPSSALKRFKRGSGRGVGAQP
jgi:hypothetical protein